MFFLASFGCKSGKTAFNNQPRLKHLPELKAVERAHQAQRRLAELGRTILDERSHSVPHFHHPHRYKVANACAKAGSANLECACKHPFRGDSVARLQYSFFQESADVVDHLLGPVGLGRIQPRACHN